MKKRFSNSPDSRSSQVVDAADTPATFNTRARRRRVRWIVRGLVSAFLVGLFVIGFDGCFYYPSREVFTTPRNLGLEYEDVSFAASDGVKLSGWFIPATTPRPRGTVIHFHGNAENMTAHITFSWWFPSHGYNLLAFDYRGYGKSAGHATRAGTIRDGHAALDYVLSRKDVDPNAIYFFGQSLGGAIATVVAAERPEVRALVLDSTFSSYRRIAATHLKNTLLWHPLAATIAAAGLSGGYEPVDYIRRFAPRPVFMIISGADRICYPSLGQELFDAAREPKELWTVPGAEHTGAIPDQFEEASRRIVDFLERAGPK